MLIGVQAGAQTVPALTQPGSETDTAAGPAPTTQQVRRDERKAALREVLKHRREASENEDAEAPRRALNLQERAELRQQLRQQSFAGRHRP